MPVKYPSKIVPDVAAESANAALKHIVDGFLRFHHDVFPEQKELFKKLATAQTPRAMFITCADSRIVPELITQSLPGDLFVTRNVGNVVPPYGQMNGGVSSAIEYAVSVLGVHHIIVCGHSDCGAMRAVLNPLSLTKIPTVAAWLRHAEVARTVVENNCSCESEHETMGALTRENVIAQLHHLRTHPSVASGIAAGQLFIHGWVYDIETSQIEAYDVGQDRFLPLAMGEQVPSATPRYRPESLGRATL